MAIGILFALVTLFLKLQSKSFIKFGKDNDELKAIVYHMQNIYWLMFIYFCMHVMDEMIELFSTINQMEKGALGLFFEMNHIIGLSLTIYIGWFVFVQSKDIDTVVKSID